MADRNKTDSPGQTPDPDWAASTAKNPDDFEEAQDEPMTEEQASQLRLLAQEADVPFHDTLTQSEAARRINELQQRTGKRP